MIKLTCAKCNKLHSRVKENHRHLAQIEGTTTHGLGPYSASWQFPHNNLNGSKPPRVVIA